MRVLLLGGMRFLGAHLVHAALARGHRMTVFNRGSSGPVPDGVERLAGDRGGDLSALAGRTWDVVVDTSGYVPRHVLASARALAGATPFYAFVSTAYVYDPLEGGPVAESAPVRALRDLQAEHGTVATYGPLKAACEAVLAETFPGSVLVVRPGPLAGPLDPSDRLAWWLRASARSGPFAAPGAPGRPVQLLDARDLAAWIVAMAERGDGGTFNAAADSEGGTMGALMDACARASGGGEAVWLPDEFLLERGFAAPDPRLPLWFPARGPGSGIYALDASRARAAGLRPRPLAETVADTAAWDRTLPADRPLRMGLAPEAEQALLEAWAAVR